MSHSYVNRFHDDLPGEVIQKVICSLDVVCEEINDIQ